MGNTMTVTASTTTGTASQAQWFERVVLCYQRKAFLAALGFLGNPEDAREASQEAFARAYRALPSFDPERPFYPWYYQILRNLCLTRITRRRRAPIATENLERVENNPASLLGRTPEASAIQQDRQQRVQGAIDRLSLEHREIIYMRHYQDLSYDEMALALGVAEGTVMSRLYRARKALRQLLEEEEP